MKNQGVRQFENKRKNLKKKEKKRNIDNNIIRMLCIM